MCRVEAISACVDLHLGRFRNLRGFDSLVELETEAEGFH